MDGSQSLRLHDCIAPIASIIEEARAGRMFILLDDENRENEGDLVIPAQFATSDAVNFMAKYARGLICLALTRRRCEDLGLRLMSQSCGTPRETAFTTSIEAREGVTTGISSADRARTIAVAVNPENGRDDVVTPGHVFPLMARDGGTLIRAGHTEAAVDVARLAGLAPAGVICEIMNDDGTMARLPELVAFGQRHNILVGTIADLISHRLRTERQVKCKAVGFAPDGQGGSWRLIAYEDLIERVEHLAMLKGDISTPEPVLVRMHAVDSVSDVLNEARFGALYGAMGKILARGRGAMVLIRESKKDAVSQGVLRLSNGGRPEPALREYGVGAQILLDLGVNDMILLSDHKRSIVGLEGYGLNIVEQQAIASDAEDGRIGNFRSRGKDHDVLR